MRSTTIVVVGLLCVAAVGLSGCARGDRKPEVSPPREFKGDGCAPTADTRLVTLIDDKKLMAAENILPAVNAGVNEPALRAALDRVSKALDQARLIGLNKAVEVTKKTPQAAAEEFATANKLTDGLTRGIGRKIVVGVTISTENQTLGHLYRIALVGAGYDASVLHVGAREVYEPALERGVEIQVVPEYLGTLAEFLNRKVNGDRAAPVASGDLDKTTTELAKLGANSRVGLAFGIPAEAANQGGFAITKALSDKYHVRTLSEFADRCSGKNTVLGGPADCPKKPSCQAGLEKSYSLAVGRFTPLDASGPLTRSGLTSGAVTIGLVSSSDPALGT